MSLARSSGTGPAARPAEHSTRGSPYGLRYSALSTWLNIGVDFTEVAERAGNCVEVLMTKYAKYLYGRTAIANQRIEALLDEYD
ncbi:hypothetical protein ACWD64_09085 [Streptomyces antibioticus]